jgi:hypothetical protein
MMGKTWLLMEAGRTFVQEGYIVGYFEAGMDADDVFLRVIEDAYERWLADASMREQAVSMWERSKGNFISDVGKAVGKLFAAALDNPIGKVVGEVFGGLAALNDELKTGGLQMKRLGYDQGKELVQIISDVSGKYVVLLMDALDQAPSKAFEMNKLQRFLTHVSDWSPCHVIVGMRPEEELLREVEKLCDRAVEAEKRLLDPLDTADTEIANAIVQELIIAVPAARRIDQKTLIKLVDGFPGVLDRWRKRTPEDEKALRSLAMDAHECRYGEVKDQFRKLSNGERRLAIRLVLFPRLTSADWNVYKELILDNDIEEGLLAELNAKGVLEGEEGTNFGHETRHDAVKRWLLEPDNNYRQHVKQELETLAFRLATRIHSVDFHSVRYTTVLRAMQTLALGLPSDPDVIALTMAAELLFPGRGVSMMPGILQAGGEIAIAKDPNTLDLVAIALANACVIVPAEQEEIKQRLASQLRYLHTHFRTSVVVAESLSRALYATTESSPADGGDSLTSTLATLREIRRMYPDSTVIRAQLGMTIVQTIFTINNSKPELADHLLAEARNLHQEAPEDDLTPGILAMAMVNASDRRQRPDDQPRQEALFDEVRQLSRKFAGWANVAFALALMLRREIDDTDPGVSREHFDTLLNELRALADNHPTERQVWRELSFAFRNILMHKANRFSPEQVAIMQEELREVYAASRRSNRETVLEMVTSRRHSALSLSGGRLES